MLGSNLRKVPFVQQSVKGVIMKIPNKVKSARYSRGIPGFLQWVKAKHPAIWHAAKYSPELSGLGAATDMAIAATGGTAQQPGTFSKIMTGISDAASKLLPLVQQQQEFQAQLKRAKAGQAPLDLDTYTGNTGYRVGMTTDTSKTLLMVAGIGAAALLGWKLLGSRR